MVTTPYFYLFCQNTTTKNCLLTGNRKRALFFCVSGIKKGFLTKKCLAICFVLVLFFWRFLPLRDSVGEVARGLTLGEVS